METPGQQVEAKSAELIQEFTDHVNEFLTLHPEDEDRRDEIFQAWVIQKLAGLQLSVTEIATRVNALIQRMEPGGRE